MEVECKGELVKAPEGALAAFTRIGDLLRETGVQLTEVGIEVQEGAAWLQSFGLWQDAGRALTQMDQQTRLALNFAIGDWYHLGCARWGHRAESVAEALPEYTYRTVRSYGYVASRYPFGHRLAQVNWKVYLELAPEPEESRLAWLAEVAAGNIPPEDWQRQINQMRRRRIAARQAPAPDREPGSVAVEDGLPVLPSGAIRTESLNLTTGCQIEPETLLDSEPAVTIDVLPVERMVAAIRGRYSIEERLELVAGLCDADGPYAVRLSPRRWDELQALADYTGRLPFAVLGEIIHRAYELTKCPGVGP